MVLSTLWPTNLPGLPGVRSTGQVVNVAGSALDALEPAHAVITLLSTAGVTKKFEFSQDGLLPGGGDIAVIYTSASTAAANAVALKDKVNAELNLRMKGTESAANVDIEQLNPSVLGDTAITLNATATTAGMTKTNYTGGVDPTGDAETIQSWHDSAADGDRGKLSEDSEVVPTSGSALTGTVTLTNGSALVTGSGTAFLTEVTLGQYIRLDADVTFVKAVRVLSDTQLILIDVYAGTGGAGAGSVATGGTGTTTQTDWNIGGALVNDFLVKTSINGTPRGGTNKISHTGYFSFGAADGLGEGSFGRCLDLNKRVTLEGDGVDGSNVPKTRITTSTQFPFAAFKANTISRMPNNPDFITNVRIDFTLFQGTQHLVQMHNKRVTLKDLHFWKGTTIVDIDHAADIDNCHWTDTGGVPTWWLLDRRAVYPNWSLANPDFSNPVPSSLTNCVFTNTRGVAVQASGVTVEGCKFFTYNPYSGGCLSAAVEDYKFGFPFVIDRIEGLYKDFKILNNEFTMLEGAGPFPSGIELFSLGPPGGNAPSVEILDGIVKGNIVHDLETVRSFGNTLLTGIGPAALFGARLENIEIEANTIRKCVSPIDLFHFFGGAISDIRIADNIFDNTRFSDTTHEPIGSGSFEDYGAEFTSIGFAGSVDRVFLSKNDYRTSGAPGLLGNDKRGGTTLLDGVTNAIVHDSGGYPIDQGGAANFVTDADGFNNRIIGLDADDVEKPAGIGQGVAGLAAKRATWDQAKKALLAAAGS